MQLKTFRLPEYVKSLTQINSTKWTKCSIFYKLGARVEMELYHVEN